MIILFTGATGSQTLKDAIAAAGGSNCKCGRWKKWSPCSKKCGKGKQTRRRNCSAACKKKAKKKRSCTGTQCS